MSKDKEKKEPKPIDKIKERQELIEAAAIQFGIKTMDIGEEFGLSAAEMFAIASQALHRLADMAMRHEHEEYFGPGSEEPEE